MERTLRLARDTKKFNDKQIFVVAKKWPARFIDGS